MTRLRGSFGMMLFEGYSKIYLKNQNGVSVFTGPLHSILSIGQFINVSTGSVGYLLMMCGYEKLMRNNLAFSVALNLILNIVLIPRLGITGAAIATASTLALQNIIAFILVWIKLDIITLPFALKCLFVKRC